MGRKLEIDQIVSQLDHKQSRKRRAAAKMARELKDPALGPALINSLLRELKDVRTWETQYQMIMAIGDMGYTDGLKVLWSVLSRDIEGQMIEVAVGDAITTLEFAMGSSRPALGTWIDCNRHGAVEGGVRALAMKKIVPDDKLIQKIVEYASKPENRSVAFWAAAASPGWPLSLVEEFLKHTLNSESMAETKLAAQSALKKRYLKWNPL